MKEVINATIGSFALKRPEKHTVFWPFLCKYHTFGMWNDISRGLWECRSHRTFASENNKE